MTDRQDQLLIFLIWIHAAFFIVPALIYVARLEWTDLMEGFHRRFVRHAHGV